MNLSASATDAESPPQTLTFSLDPGAPSGATINPTTGAFSWATTGTSVPSTNTVTVRVTDSGNPPLSATDTFSIVVLPLPQFSPARLAGATLALSFATLPGQTYQVQYTDNLTDPSWTPVSAPVTGTGEVLQVDDDISGQTQRFYRLVVLP